MIIVAYLLPFLLGFFATRVALRNTPWASSLGLPLILAVPVGFGVTSLLTFWSYVVVAPFAPKLSIALVVFLMCLFIYLEIKAGSHSQIKDRFVDGFQNLNQFFRSLFNQDVSLNDKLAGILSLVAFALFAFVLAHYAQYFIGKVSWNVFGGWDAQYFWNLKAKFLFRYPDVWRDMFNPIMDWSHPDYPLFLPATIAWGWNVTGNELYMWPPILDISIFLALVFFVVWYLTKHVSLLAGVLTGGLLIVVENFWFWSTTQYADIAVSLFFTTATLLLVMTLRAHNAQGLLLAGLLAGLSAWTKNEGIFFIGWMILLLGISLYLNQSISFESKKKMGIFFAIGLAIPASAVVFGKIFLGVEGGEYVGSGRGALDYLAALTSNFEKTQFIAACFGIFKLNYEQWHGLWLLFFAALALSGKRRFTDYRWLMLATVLLVELGYFVVLHWAPWNIQNQIQYSLMRLMMHSAVIALVYAAEAMGSLFPKNPLSSTVTK